MNKRFHWISWALVAWLAAHAAAAAPIGQEAAARRQFLAAMHRVESGEADERDSPLLRNYPLYEYLRAARLQRDLLSRPDEALDRRIERFLTSHAGEPVTRDLELDWLLSLAARSRWNTFLPRAAHIEDARVACDRLAGRLATGRTDDWPAQAIARWLEPRRQPAECTPVFAWLRRHGDLSDDLRELRTRAALAAGDGHLAQRDAEDLPPARAAPLRLWARLLEAPARTLESVADEPTVDVPAAALEAGFERLSRRDGAAAMALLPRLLARRGETSALRGRLRLDAALGAAYDHDPDALAAFAAVPPALIAGPAAEWGIRAALWAGDYRQALTWIERLPADLATEPRWQYWRARALAKTTGPAAARPVYAGIAGMRNFYGYLAADRLHQPYHLHAHPTAIDWRTQRRLASQPGLIRARELFYCAMYGRAAREWAAALAGADADTLVQAAHLATRWGWYEQSIVALKRADQWDDLRLRYPRPYAAAVAAASRLTHVPADWLLAVMRQESLYQPYALSTADARGLMQLQPATAVRIARRWHLRRPSPRDLLEPYIAVRLGAAYLRDLLDRYDGRLDLSLAAYNAGPNAVDRWLPKRPMAADVWIENIPYTETRAYIRAIVEHIVAFAWTRGIRPPRLRRLLPRVYPAATIEARVREGARKKHRGGNKG